LASYAFWSKAGPLHDGAYAGVCDGFWLPRFLVRTGLALMDILSCSMSILLVLVSCSLLSVSSETIYQAVVAAIARLSNAVENVVDQIGAMQIIL
jgi:hypothetical protein